MPTSHPGKKILNIARLRNTINLINSIEHIGTEFILFILDIVEIPPEVDVLELIPDIMINLILSLNLQFEHFADNFILNAMQKISSAKTFTEKILVLLNREGTLLTDAMKCCAVRIDGTEIIFFSRGSIEYFRTFNSANQFGAENVC